VELVNAKKFAFLLILVALLPIETACTLATVRSLEEDEAATAGFNPEDYVDNLWESQLLPYVRDNSVQVTELLAEIARNESRATEKYGKRSRTGAYSFLIYGDAQVLGVDLDSRIGLMSIDFAPYDGDADANMAIGPVIRNRNESVHDAVGFIQFNDFVNQTEFAGVGSAIKDRILRDVISTLDLETAVGTSLHFYGAFTLDDLSNIEIVPIILEAAD
jgi:predicted lipoprotein